jgi:hypothetical protein
MKTYCFDLDGTLCTQIRNDSGKPSQDPGEVYAQAQPIKDRIAVVNRLHREGNKILIDTARGSKNWFKRAEWLELTINQLKEWGIKYDGLRLGEKLVADFYIDDLGHNDVSFFKNVKDSRTDPS